MRDDDQVVAGARRGVERAVRLRSVYFRQRNGWQRNVPENSFAGDSIVWRRPAWIDHGFFNHGFHEQHGLPIAGDSCGHSDIQDSGSGISVR